MAITSVAVRREWEKDITRSFPTQTIPQFQRIGGYFPKLRASCFLTRHRLVGWCASIKTPQMRRVLWLQIKLACDANRMRAQMPPLLLLLALLSDVSSRRDFVSAARRQRARRASSRADVDRAPSLVCWRTAEVAADALPSFGLPSKTGRQRIQEGGALIDCRTAGRPVVSRPTASSVCKSAAIVLLSARVSRRRKFVQYICNGF